MPNLAVMKRLSSIVLVACFLGLPSASAAAATPTFRSSTEGLPAGTIQGIWSETEEGRAVSLQLGGGHLVAARTKFRAGWLTPWTTRGQFPEFNGSFAFESMNQLGEHYRLNWEMRFRQRGEEWGSWFKHSFGFKGGSYSATGGGSAFGSFSKESYRFEWRLSGKVLKTTTLQGQIDLRVN